MDIGPFLVICTQIMTESHDLLQEKLLGNHSKD